MAAVKDTIKGAAPVRATAKREAAPSFSPKYGDKVTLEVVRDFCGRVKGEVMVMTWSPAAAETLAKGFIKFV